MFSIQLVSNECYWYLPFVILSLLINYRAIHDNDISYGRLGFMRSIFHKDISYNL